MQGRTALAACVGVGLVLSACAVESPGTNRGSQESVVSRGGPDQEQPVGDVASWLLSEDQLLDPTTSFLVLDVTRLGCSGGVTGSVLDPVVVSEPDRVVIRTDVEPVGGANDCQGNDAVSVEIALDESLGMRELVDAACLHGEAVGTAACPGAVRWAPPEGLERHGGVPDWQAPPAYSFTVQSSCGEQAFIGEYAVTVDQNEVVSVEVLRQGWADITVASVPSIADMLDLAREADSQGEAQVWVDAEGMPRWLELDPMPNAVDDENCFLITQYNEN